MTEGTSKRGKGGKGWRYRAYFRLMDIATVVVVISCLQLAMDPEAMSPEFEPDIWHQIVGWLSFLLPLFLIFARRWRDEFAELCWHQSAATTIKGLFLAPLLLLFVMGIAAGWNHAHQEAAGGSPPPPVNPLDALSGVQALGICWGLLITLFVLAFQFHRWRGSR